MKKNGWKRLLPKYFLSRPLVENASKEVVLIDGITVKEIEFLGVSRLGNLSWKGKIDGVSVKIFEAFNSDHARTVENIMQLDDLRDLFPEFYFRKDKYLIVEWVDGDLLDSVMTSESKEFIQQIFWLQHRIHHSTSTLTQPYFFNYYEYLVSRYAKYVGPFNQSNTQFLKSFSLPDHSNSPYENCYFHLDITPQNLILHEKKIKIIDNELLGFGMYYPFDFFNTYHSIRCTPSSEEYLRLIREYEMDNLRWILNDKEDFLHMWNLRMVGSSIQSKKPFSSLLLPNEPPLNHPIFQWLEK